MKHLVVPAIGLVLGACASPDAGPNAGPSSYLLAPRPNTAPRGSAEFCRIYGRQTEENRLRFSSSIGGRGGPNGVDMATAQKEGARAEARCRAGRTN